MLAIQWQVVGKFVNQQSGDEADVGPAALNDTGRRVGADQCLVTLELDYRPAILDHHVATRPLRQAIAVLVADDLVVLGREAFDFRRGELDDFDWDAVLVEEGHAFVTGTLAGRLTGMRGDGATW